ncbi:MAG: Uma2 family endonuclease [Candidatus Saccharimonas sp.]|nr:Uma2 family endonuclease [Planctomycetaceae bacterium]
MIATLPQSDSLADMLHRLGDIPPERILARPAPGTAMPSDVLRLCDGEPKRLCELVDGVLVEKAMGQRESRLAFWLGVRLAKYVEDHRCGILTGADGPHHLTDDQIRFPDVVFISWDNIPPDADPGTPMPAWIPSLAVEVISPGNTRGEMKRKLTDYFTAGVELVWYVYPKERVVRVYTSEEDCRTLTEDDSLDGGSVLPGFQLSVRQLFDAGEFQRPTK